jgi:protein-disulfide isomerase
MKVSRFVDVAALAIVVTAMAVITVAILRPHISRSGDVQRPQLNTKGSWIGPDAATVVLVIYSDYACGYCADYHDTVSTLRDMYPDHLGIVIRHYVRGTDSGGYNVALAAECAAEQGRFAAYHSAAFRNRDRVQDTDSWLVIGREAALSDTIDFKDCVRSRRYDAALDEQYTEGVRRGVNGTPTSFVGRTRLTGAMPLGVVDSIVAAQLPSRAQTRY